MAPYPKEFKTRVEATSIATASGRALREWKKTTKGKRIGEIKVSIIKL